MASETQNKSLDVIKTFFHSFSQVVLLENVISGVLILAAIAIYDYNMAILAAIGAIIGNLTALYFTKENASIEAGLYGFCPVLVGCAAGLFMSGVDSYIATVLGVILCIPLTVVVNKLCGRLNLPGFTLPFILMTWFLILISFNSGLLNTTQTPKLAEAITAGEVNLVIPDGLLKGIGEIFLLDSVYSSLLILLAFIVAKWQLGIGLVFTVAMTIGLGYIFKVDFGTLSMGLLTYNSILSFMGLETFSKTQKAQRVVHVILAVIFTFLVDLAAPVVLGVYGLPSLTFPFVLVTWGMLYFEQFIEVE